MKNFTKNMEKYPKINPNSMKLKKCVTCGKVDEHHGKGMCRKCYKKQWVSSKVIICPECKREKTHHGKGLCASCYTRVHGYEHIKRYNARKYHDLSLELYRQITQFCVSCSFSKIVELHHLDGDKKNNSSNNLVGLCPNCHKMIHSFDYFEEIKANLKQKGFPVDKIHPSSYVKPRKDKSRVD